MNKQVFGGIGLKVIFNVVKEMIRSKKEKKKKKKRKQRKQRKKMKIKVNKM